MLLKASHIRSCYIGPQISPEQFIAEHFFLYIAKGTIHGYDGNNHYSLGSGECCVVRKNHLARYNKEREDGQFEKVVIIFDQFFLKQFRERHGVVVPPFQLSSAFVLLRKRPLITHFIGSLMPYYTGAGKIDARFADVKREELLLILLQDRPELATILFDFGIPEKSDLEAFMNKNYHFNVSIERFAYLTGRSLSAFKRDFEKVFGDTPSRWLVQRRLREGHFLIEQQHKKASDIYLDLGFEDLSHFSYAFKKRFGYTPRSLAGNRQKTNS